MNEKISAIILASGMSSRFSNSVPHDFYTKNKLDIIINNKPLIENTLEIISSVNFDEIIICTNSNYYDRIIKQFNVKHIINTNFEKGIGTSIKQSINVVNKNNRLMFFVCDVPKLDVSNINLLINCSNLHTDKVIRPFYDNNFYSPVIFPSKYLERLKTIEDNKGGISIIDKNEIYILENESFLNLKDIDTYDDFLKFI